MDAISVNRITKGVFGDTHPAYQPEGTLRESMNGELVRNADGYYVWKPIHGNELYINLTALATTSYHLGWVMIRNKLVIIINEHTDAIVSIYTVDTETNIAPVAVLVKTYTHATWGTRAKIKSIFSYYENEDKQWIVFSDNTNPPRIINIDDPIADIESANISPQMIEVQLDLYSIGSGSLRSGTYYIVWRYKNADGFTGSWSNISGPYTIGSHIGTPVGGYDDYQNLEADYHSVDSGKSITFSTNTLDARYDYLEVAYLYYPQFNVFDSGMVFYREAVTAAPLTYIALQSNSGYEAITIDDVLLNYITILKAKEVELVENRCTLGNIEEASELDEGEDMACDISALEYEFSLDCTVPSPDESTLTSAKALTGIKPLADTLIDVLGIQDVPPDPFNYVFRCATDEVDNGDIIKFTGDATLATGFGTLIHDYKRVVDKFNGGGYTYFNLVDPGDYSGTSYFNSFGIVTGDDPALKICKMPVSLIPHINYIVDSPLTYWDGTEALNTPTTAIPGDVVKLASGSGIIVSGTVKPVIHLSRYYNYLTSANVYKDTQITDGHLNYKGVEMCKYLRGYGRKEKVRLALIGIDKYGKTKYARYLRDNTTGGDFTMPDIATSPIIPTTNSFSYTNIAGTSGGEIYPYVNGAALGIEINNLDITDIIDDISAFMIVRAPIISRYAARGVLEFMYNHPSIATEINRAIGFRNLSADVNRQENNYVFLSPDHLYSNPEFSVTPGAKLENIEYYTCHRRIDAVYDGAAYEGLGTKEFNMQNYDSKLFYAFYQKFTKPTNAPVNSNGVIDKTNEILVTRNLEVMMESFNGDPKNPGKLVLNQVANFPHANSIMYGSRGLYMVTNDYEGPASSSTNPIGHHNLSVSTPKILYCGILKNENVEYGSIYDTGYVDTGHFQVVDATFKSRILTGGKYIIDKLQLFGGDTYIGMFDVLRLYTDWANGAAGSTGFYNHSIIFPCESKLNFELRKGVHVAKDRSYRQTGNVSGLKIDLSGAGTYGGTKLEEFFVNTGFSVTETEVKYPQLPLDFNNLYKFDTRIRWSEMKVINESGNSFRNFPALNKRDFNPVNKAITNIRYRKQRLFCWQPEAFGYSPYLERELTQNALGVPIQIGIGGEFDRTDELLRRMGNSHQEGLVEVDNGYIWCDYLRKEMYHFDVDNGLQNLSLSLGFDKLLKTILSGLQFGYDAARSGGQGICGGYDPINKIAYMTIEVYDAILGALPTTIAINMEHNIFMGKVKLDAWEYINTGKTLLTTNIGEVGLILYKQSDSVYSFWGTDETAYMIIVINKDVEVPKVFDNIEVETGSNFADTIIYSNEVSTVTDIIANFTTGVLSSSDFEYIDGLLKGNIPLIAQTSGFYSRIQKKGYLLIKMSVNSQRTDKDVYMRSIKTKYRQIY